MFWEDPKKRKTAALWCIGVVSACLIIFLAVQNINVVARSIAWLFDLVFPMILGAAFALILNVPMCPIERNLFSKSKKFEKMSRPFAILLSLIIIFGLFAGVIILVVPALTDAVVVFGKSIIQLLDVVKNFEKSNFHNILPWGIDLSKIDAESMVNSVIEWLKGSAPNVMGSTFSIIGTVGSSIVNFIIGLVFSIYILFNKEKLSSQIKRLVKAWIPEKAGSVVLHVASVFCGTFRRFIAGQTVEAVILGSLCALGMLALRLPYAPMIGALVGVTALIPIVGAFIGTIVGGFMILTISPIKALIFVIFLLVLQQIEGNLIYPRVVGSSIGLPAMWVLAAVTIGGSLGGPVGMLLGVPVTSALYILVKEATQWKESQQKKLTIGEEEQPDGNNTQ